MQEKGIRWLYDNNECLNYLINVIYLTFSRRVRGHKLMILKSSLFHFVSLIILKLYDQIS